MRRTLLPGLAAAVLLAGPVAAAEVRVTVVNDSGQPATVVMTETPTAAVDRPWPRVLEPDATAEAAFSFPDMTGALGMVQYALPAEADGDSRTCLFRWATDTRRVVFCEGVVVAQPVGVGAIGCEAEVLDVDHQTCAFTARFTLR